MDLPAFKGGEGRESTYGGGGGGGGGGVVVVVVGGVVEKTE